MQKGKNLQFACQKCESPIEFSLFDLKENSPLVKCLACGKQYVFDDPVLLRQLGKFERLCKQIQESAEILDNASVGIDFDGKQIKIPYKLLLTRFNSSLDLVIGDRPLSILFRLEPALDYKEKKDE